MLLSGDEFRRSQGGNNNTYCQDNETSWIDWSQLERNQDIFRFAQGMIAFRVAHPILSKAQFYTDAEISWYGSQGGLPGWTDAKGRQFSCLIHEDEQRALFLIFNSSADAVDFHLPPIAHGARWLLAADTAEEAPCDMIVAGKEPILGLPRSYRAKPHSSAILLTRMPELANDGGRK
jgi:glycogen operon protein